MPRVVAQTLSVALAAAATGPLAAQPSNAAPGAGDLLIVLEKDSAAARLIDVGSGATVARLPTGPFPHEVAASPDGSWAVVADYGAQQGGRTLTVLDLRGRRVARTIDLGEYRRPHGIMWLAGPGQRVAVTAEGSQALLVVDVAAGRVERAVRTGQQGTHMVVLAPAAGGATPAAWTANMGSGSVSRLDLAAGAVARTAPNGRVPEAIDVSPDGREVWTADRELARVSVLDATTLDSLAAFPSGRFPNRLKFTPDGRTVLVSNAADGTLGVYDARARRLVTALPLGEGRPGQAGPMNPTGRGPVPLGIQIAPDGRRAWVALNSAGAVAEVALAPGDPSATRVVRRIEAGAGPDGMAYAPGAPR